ncbi:MAG: hypothetical protein WA771_04575 [Chthoniobacterales bacterium]
MFAIHLLFGLILIVLGAVSYFITGADSPTALIPAFVGAALVLFGALARMGHVMNLIFAHLAVLLGVVGALGGLGMSIPKLMSGVELVRPMAIYMQLAMGLILFVYVIFCVRSFIAARRARQATTT